MEPKKSVGIWIRVSTEDQVKGESPEHHEKRARYYAEAKGWDIKKVYHLEALSGKSVMNYPQTKEMLADIRSGHITGLIFSKLARLARNTKELLDFADIFRDEDADLISLQESIDTSTPAGRLFYTMIAAMAQWEREEISSRVAASVPIRAKLGKQLGGQASYGYKWEGNALVLDAKEAPVRKLIYELFLKHKRKKTVANELTTMGYRTRNGSKFSDTTIDRLLRDPTAKGERRANYTKSLGDNKKWEVKPVSDWVIMPCAPIISEEVWNECNTFLDAQVKKRSKPGRRAVQLLSGYVYCTCGKKMYVYHEKSDVYSCKLCKTRIAATDIDEIYHEQLKSFLLTDTDINEYLTKSDGIIKEKDALMAVLTKEGESLRKSTDELVHMRMRKEMTPENFQKHYKPQEERLAQIEQQLPELQAEIDFLKIQLLSSDTVIREANDLYSSWTTLEFEQKRSIVETITERITIGKEDIDISLAYLPATPLNTGNKQRNFIVALGIGEPAFSTKNPLFLRKYDFPINTIGDILKKRRLDLHLLQSDVAKQIGVTTDAVTFWENHRANPNLMYYPAIIQFLGFNPFDFPILTFGDKIKYYRITKGLSLKKLGRLLNVDGTTIGDWEENRRLPRKAKLKLLKKHMEIAI